MNTWPFINGAYGASVLFLAVAGWLSLARYLRARRRLAEVEKR